MNYSDIDNYYLEWEIRHEKSISQINFDIWAVKTACMFLLLTVGVLNWLWFI